MAKIDFDKLLFSPEAGAIITEIAGRLAMLSIMTGLNQEPEITAETLPNGDLLVK